MSSKLSYNLLSVTTLEDHAHTTHSGSIGNSVRSVLNELANLINKSVGEQRILSHQRIYDGVDDFVAYYPELVLANLPIGSGLKQYVYFIVGRIVVPFGISSALLFGKGAINRILRVVNY